MVIENPQGIRVRAIKEVVQQLKDIVRAAECIHLDCDEAGDEGQETMSQNWWRVYCGLDEGWATVEEAEGKAKRAELELAIAETYLCQTGALLRGNYIACKPLGCYCRRYAEQVAAVMAARKAAPEEVANALQS